MPPPSAVMVPLTTMSLVARKVRLLAVVQVIGLATVMVPPRGAVKLLVVSTTTLLVFSAFNNVPTERIELPDGPVKLGLPVALLVVPPWIRMSLGSSSKVPVWPWAAEVSTAPA